MAPMEIQVIKSVSEFQWNHEVIKEWARQYAAQYAGLMVNEENLKEMEEVKKEIAGKRAKLDEFRKAAKKDFEKPLKQFESEVKDVLNVLQEVEIPIAEQIQKYEDRRREEKSKEIQRWIETMAGAAGLRPSFAKMLTVQIEYTNRTATKSKVTQDISRRIDTLMEMQKAEDTAEEMRAQKIKMAAQLCQAQSQAFELTTPIGVEDVHGIESIDLGDLAAFICSVAKRRKEAEDAARRPAQVETQSEAPRNPEPVPEPSQALYSLTMQFRSMTVAQAQKLKTFLDENGYDYQTIEKARVA